MGFVSPHREGFDVLSNSHLGGIPSRTLRTLAICSLPHYRELLGFSQEQVKAFHEKVRAAKKLELHPHSHRPSTLFQSEALHL